MMLLLGHHLRKQIPKEVINGWFRGVFDSSDGNNCKLDKMNNAVVAERDSDGLLSEESFNFPGSNSSAWFIQMFNLINYLNTETVYLALQVIMYI